METTKQRIDFIDLAKGFCIILVVFTHVNTYFKLDYALKDVLASFRMPLYFILSGLFFKKYSGFYDFVKRKANNLLIPFFFFYLTLSFMLPNLLYLIGYNVRHTDKLGWNSIFNFIFYDQFSNSPIWFLLCLFWVNVIFYNILIISGDKIWKIVISTFVCGICGYALGRCEVQVYMYLDAALTAVPFFCAGYLLKKYTNVLLPNKWDKYSIWFILFCFLFVYLFAAPMNFVGNRFPPNSFIQLYSCGIIGTLFVLLLSKKLKKHTLISYWGRYSVIVLCLHNPVIQVVVPFINRLPLDSWLSLILTLIIVMFSFLIIIPIMKRYFPYVTAQKNLIPIS